MIKALLSIGIVIAILFAIWAVETAIDRFRPATGTPLRLLAAFGMVGLIILGLVKLAQAHDRARPELDSWYRSLHSKANAWCCDGSDSTHVADADWESRAGHYRVRLEGQWYDVPDAAVIDGPNRDGRTLVWPSTGYGGLTIRCFLPGSMT